MGGAVNDAAKGAARRVGGLFRVFAAAHPQIRITPVNAAPAVDQMIRRAVAARTATAEPH